MAFALAEEGLIPYRKREQGRLCCFGAAKA